eukprot:3479986-Rhodomonas_salina.1
MFLDGGVKLADVLTRGASRDEVSSVEIRWHVESLRVDYAFDTKEKAGAFNELEVLCGEDDGAQRVDVWRLRRLGVVAEERLDEVREEVVLCVKQPITSLLEEGFHMG